MEKNVHWLIVTERAEVKSLEGMTYAVSRYLYENFFVAASVTDGVTNKVLVGGKPWGGFTVEAITVRLRSGVYGVREVSRREAEKEMGL